VTIGTSVFDGNRVQPVDLGASGGAIAASDISTVTISDTWIGNNHAEPNITPGTGNTSLGGGISAWAATALKIERSEIAGNSAQVGGGLWIAAPGAAFIPPGATYDFRLNNSTVSGNTPDGLVLQNGV
jgi:hypothetical protein